MSGERLSAVQRIARALLPARIFAGIEAESKEWKMICPHCGFARSVWEMGGIRYKASGTPRRLALCPGCGESGWHPVRRERP